MDAVFPEQLERGERRFTGLPVAIRSPFMADSPIC